METHWNVSGSYFETCNCDTACPCAFLSPPSKGECTLFCGWHIEQGHFADVRLDGLNVALAAHSPGHMMEVKWKAALYVDERANDDQRNALTQIFTGKVGGHPGRLASHFGEILGVKAAPIEYQSNAKHKVLKIAQIADAEIEDLAGEGVDKITITQRPWSIVRDQEYTVAKSKHMDFDDYDLHWHVSGENGYHSPFTYQP